MPFGAFKDVGERRSLDHERAQRRQQEAMGQWQYVNATFGTANVDLLIPHTLIVVNPEDVRYIVVRSSGPAVVYQDLSVSREPWSKGIIRLRASAPTAARLLLFTETPNTAPAVATVGP